MSNGEVKRWYLYTENEALYAVSKNQRGFVPDASTIEVMRVADHERIVTELRAKIASITSQYQASSIEWGQTIAKQKRVIKKLSEQKKSSFFTKEQNEKWAEEALDDATENDY